jgi:hypothetical protein
VKEESAGRDRDFRLQFMGIGNHTDSHRASPSSVFVGTDLSVPYAELTQQFEANGIEKHARVFKTVCFHLTVLEIKAILNLLGYIG